MTSRTKEKSSSLKQTRLWGRALKVKEEKEAKERIKSGLPFNRITASMIKSYKTCKKLFYYQYILNLRLPTKSIPLVFGGAFHKGIEAYYEDKDPVKEFMTHFTREGIRDIKKPEMEAKFQENQLEGVRLMEIWKEEAPKINKEWGIVKEGISEEKFRTWWVDPTTHKRLPVAVSGRFDRTTKTHQILEFKTSRKPYKQEDVDILDQASIYNYSYYLTTKQWPTEIFYIVFIKGRKNNPIQVLRTKRTKGSITQTYEMIEMLLSDIKGRREQDYTYGEDFLHKYCDCKLYEEMLLL